MSYWKAIGSKVVEKDQHERKAVFFSFCSLCFTGYSGSYGDEGVKDVS